MVLSKGELPMRVTVTRSLERGSTVYENVMYVAQLHSSLSSCLVGVLKLKMLSLCVFSGKKLRHDESSVSTEVA